MITIPNRVRERLVSGLKRFQPILESAKTRDVNESDTVIIITDMLSEIFGYDKYSEITSEFSIRGTYCDLATKIDSKVQTLIEVKAIGLDLKDTFVKQAVDYAANQGIDWICLTNGINWKIFKVTFGKPIDQELVVDFEFTKLSFKNIDDLEKLYFLTREGWLKAILDGYHAQKQVLSRYFLASLLLSDSVCEVVRRELRKISPDIKIDSNSIKEVIKTEVLKREVVEGEKFEEAKKTITRALNKNNRLKIKHNCPKVSEVIDLSVTQVLSHDIQNKDKTILIE
jgi:hypothetical protein